MNCVLGENIEDALRNLRSAHGTPVTKKVCDASRRTPAARKPYAASCSGNDLFDWFRQMNQPDMGLWNWLVLFHWQVCRSGSEINIEDFARSLEMPEETVSAAIKDLSDAGFLRILDEKRSGRTVVSRTVELKLGGAWGVKTIFS